jgi:succinyl-diaminopimelate desuccinylase
MALDLTQPIEALLCQLVDIASVSHDEERLADAVQEALASLPMFAVERLGNNVVARTESGSAERVVVAGHLDTVSPAGNTRARIAPDSAGRRAVHGIGACDMKGGVAAMLVSLARLHEGQLRRDITAVFYECEEVAGEHNGLRRIHQTRPELLIADAAVLCEPSNAGIEAGCQGTLRAVVRTRGVRAHTARAWMGDNAIHAAMPILQNLLDYSPRAPEINGLRFREGLQAVAIAGGVAGNVVPDECAVTVNYRFAPDRDEAAAQAHVREVFAGFEVEIVDCAGGAMPYVDHPHLAELVAISSRVASAAVAPKLGWTDVARFASMGIPAVNFGPGDPALAHSPDECVAIDEVQACADALTEWLSA